MRLGASEVGALLGAGVSASTLTNIGIVVGIVTAILTFALNAYCMTRKRDEERQEHDARMKLLEEREARDGG